ncbi:AsnC family protein [Halomarina rubra]|uniref:AsnC family protein n=1 Tax=Halomarina rubra TaxID=2071873 RepID=A0ABD6AXA9_9EURY|nr:AsnC family transcriptional regulator [Halomarina rubra]
MTGTNDSNAIDEIDRKILSILAHDPRTPYSNISTQLAEEGIEMSSEGVRRRVTALLEITTSFHLLRPDGHDWEIVMVTAQVAHEDGAKQAVFEAMSEMNFWFVGSGFGTIDLYGISTVNSNKEIDALVNRVRSLPAVTTAEYMIETDRATNVERYLQFGE